jgi:hypothetical protein
VVEIPNQSPVSSNRDSVIRLLYVVFSIKTRRQTPWIIPWSRYEHQFEFDEIFEYEADPLVWLLPPRDPILQCAVPPLRSSPRSGDWQPNHGIIDYPLRAYGCLWKGPPKKKNVCMVEQYNPRSTVIYSSFKSAPAWRKRPTPKRSPRISLRILIKMDWKTCMEGKTAAKTKILWRYRFRTRFLTHCVLNCVYDSLRTLSLCWKERKKVKVEIQYVERRG